MEQRSSQRATRGSKGGRHGSFQARPKKKESVSRKSKASKRREYCDLEEFIRRHAMLFKMYRKRIHRTIASLFIINVFIWLSGIALMTIGLLCFFGERELYLLINASFQYTMPCYMVLICGCLSIFLSFFGCVITYENMRLFIYIISSLVLATVIAVASYLFFVDLFNVDSFFEDRSKALFILQYGRQNYVTDNVDGLQQRLQCCGLNSYMDWLESEFAYMQYTLLKQGYRIPSSCCIDPTSTACTTNYTKYYSAIRGIGIYTKPCLTLMKNWMENLLTAACAVTCTVIIVLLMAVFTAFIAFLFRRKPALPPEVAREAAVRLQKLKRASDTRIAANPSKNEVAPLTEEEIEQ